MKQDWASQPCTTSPITQCVSGILSKEKESLSSPLVRDRHEAVDELLEHLDLYEAVDELLELMPLRSSRASTSEIIINAVNDFSTCTIKQVL